MAVAQKVCCRVERILDHGDHVYTVDLVPDKRVPMFKPGQFMHLALDTYDPSDFWPESRVFSIANSPKTRDHINITYSVRGYFTARMEKELRIDRQVWIKMPYGDFVIRDTGDIVLLAGGTGITAFTAFLDELTPTFEHNVYLAYGARTSSLLIYRNLADRCAAALPQLQLLYFVEHDAYDSAELRSAVVGRVSIAVLWQHLENPFMATYYISGPPEMIKILSGDLKQRGVGADSIRIDAWE
jgi:ferredoxin-NADP reductase